MRNKTKYQPPMIEVIQVENEGIIAGSTGTSAPPYTGGGSALGNTRGRSANTHQSPGAMQDFEDLINDILTVKK